jgi:hypothetical protein
MPQWPQGAGAVIVGLSPAGIGPLRAGRLGDDARRGVGLTLLLVGAVR